MCGLFGYCGPGADPELLLLAAEYGASRGPHGHGWWTPGRGLHRKSGPLTAHEVPADVLTIGHARLATTGDYRDESQLQPAVRNGNVITHNGHVPEWEAWQPGQATDTLAIARVYDLNRAAGMKPPAALKTTMRESRASAWALAVYDHDGTLLLWRTKMPLWLLKHRTGRYWCSRQFHPAARLVPERPIVITTEVPVAA